LFSGVFIAEEEGGVGDKDSGGTTIIDIQTFLEAFLNMSLRSASFTVGSSLVKNKTSGLEILTSNARFLGFLDDEITD
jgi:hypothetical protein